MRGWQQLLLFLGLWVALLMFSRRMLAASLGNGVAQRVERVAYFLIRSWFAIVLSPFRLALAVIRLRLRHGRPHLHTPDTSLTDLGPPAPRVYIDRDVFHGSHRRRR